MKKMVFLIASVSLIIFSFYTSSICLGQDHLFEGRIDIGTHCLFLTGRGQGIPTFVLDVGVGGTYQDWLPILENIAQKTQVVAYDRAGYGQSDKGPFPRNSSRIADELKKLLDTAKIPGPYILVGHSLGGLNVQIFALKYPEDTAGLVLLDPPPLGWILGDVFPGLKDMFQREVQNLKNAANAAENAENQREQNRAGYLNTLASEHESLINSSSAVMKSCRNKFWRNLPIYVIASGIPNPQFGEDAARFQKYWNNQCLELASRSFCGRYYFSPTSSHHIPRDDPELVLDVLEKILIEINKDSE